MPALDMEKSRINLIGVFYVFLGRLTLVNEDIPGSAARGKAACIGILRNSGVGTHGSCAHALHTQTLSPVPAQDPTPLMPFSGHFSPPNSRFALAGQGGATHAPNTGGKGRRSGCTHPSPVFLRAAQVRYFSLFSFSFSPPHPTPGPPGQSPVISSPEAFKSFKLGGFWVKNV